MHQVFSQLLLYSDLGEDSILERLSELMRDWSAGEAEPDVLRRRIFLQVKRLLDLSTTYGFDENLWANYLTFLLMTNENSFTLSCERVGAHKGSVNHLALQDFRAFHSLLHYDFSPLEAALNIDCFRVLQNYQAVPKRERHYHKAVSEKVKILSRALMQAVDANELFTCITEQYRAVGVGMFGLNRAFRMRQENARLAFLPINNTDGILLSDLVGYDLQKQRLRENTEAFLDGRPANNVLLYGDSGTGKSSSVKALINEYYDRGLRMIELYKHQFGALSQVMAETKNRNYRFILFIDDLSFEENEVEYKYLKALIEGGVETKPDNILLYATSNRRHLIRETWKDRGDTELNGDIHRSDTVEEKLSLSARFGVQINYSVPNHEQFRDMILQLAQRQGIDWPNDVILGKANQWELRHGGISGRTAQQFINNLLGQQESVLP